MRESRPNVRFAGMPFMAVTADHWESRDAALNDLERCFQIMDLAKRYKVPIKIISPRNRFKSPYWYYFEGFEIATTYFESYSYVEYMLHSTAKKFNIQWFEVINDPLKWGAPNVNYLLKLFTQTDWIERFGFRRWGDNFANKAYIDYSVLSKFTGTRIKSATNEAV